MDPVTILIVVAICVILLWTVNTYIPMPSTVRMVVNIVAVVLILAWVVYASGLLR